MNGMLRDRLHQPRRRARVAGAKAGAGADAREGEGEAVERDRVGRDRAAVDAARRLAQVVVRSSPRAPR
jgi:hypothetical protein